jgi:hypothetical protein
MVDAKPNPAMLSSGTQLIEGRSYVVIPEATIRPRSNVHALLSQQERPLRCPMINHPAALMSRSCRGVGGRAECDGRVARERWRRRGSGDSAPGSFRSKPVRRTRARR